MNKEQFLAAVRSRLAYLPEEDVEKALAFYAESIDDRVEDGMSEAGAVAAMGGADAVARAIESQLPLGTIVRQRVKNSRARSGRGVWWVILAVFASPVWLTLACVLGAAAVAVFAVVLAAVASAFALLAALGVSAVCMLIYAVTRLFAAGPFAALMCLGMSLAMAGLTLSLLRPCAALTRVSARLPASFCRWVKGLIMGRGSGR